MRLLLFLPAVICFLLLVLNTAVRKRRQQETDDAWRSNEQENGRSARSTGTGSLMTGLMKKKDE